MPPSRNGTPFGGRKPTPRSVRIMSVQDPSVPYDTYARDREREPTDQTRVPSGPIHPRAWSRGTASLLDRRMLEDPPRPPRPRFRGRNLRLDYLRNPSGYARLYFYMLPLFVFAHIPFQTFFDFNVVFILIQVAKFPNPSAPGVAGDGHGWELGAAAYLACWLIQMIGVCIMYEFVYSFYRRWRQKRPLILPIYLSAPALNFARMTGYDTYSFLTYLRLTAFSPDHAGSTRDGLAESCWFLAQNLPTVVLLLPRAALCLALLLQFSAPVPGELALADEGVQNRDGTFFDGDGTLTSYARGVLIANAAWTAWRAIVLIASWLGLWLLSEQGCAGLCGPRYRWEEDEAMNEKALSVYSEGGDPFGGGFDGDGDRLAWSWRECTAQRVQQVYEACLATRLPQWRRSRPGKEASEGAVPMDLGTTRERRPEVQREGTGLDDEGVARVLAAVGLPTSPLPARRGILTGELFESPVGLEKALSGEDPPQLPELSDIIPPLKKPPVVLQRDDSSPLMALPYPFTQYPAQTSSADRVHVQPVPFPPSPGHADDNEDEGDEVAIDVEDDDEDMEEGDEEYEEEGEGELGEYSGGSGDPSSAGRTSESMSSLGHPIVSRYPFQFRTPPPARRGSRPSDPSSRGTMSSRSRASGSGSGSHSGSHSGPPGSRGSRKTPQSTSTRGSGSGAGYAPSAGTSTQDSSNGSSPPISPSQAYLRTHGHGHARGGSLSGFAPIPMPPGGNAGRKRARAGTVPTGGGSQVPEFEYDTAEFQAGPEGRVRTESAATEHSATFGPVPLPVYEGVSDEEDYEGEGRGHGGAVSEMGELVEVREDGDSMEIVEGEREDSVGLLSHAPSRTSLGALRHRTRSNSRSRSGSRNNSQTSRSNSHSGSHPGSAPGSSSNLPLPSIRSRAQSLIHSIGAASRSSVELAMRGTDVVRSRANSSIARLSDSAYMSQSEQSNSGSGSDNRPSTNGDHTFGVPFPLPSTAAASRMESHPHPLRTEVPQEGSLHDSPEGTAAPTPTAAEPLIHVREATLLPPSSQDMESLEEDPTYLDVPILHPSRSDLTGGPSQRSERTITPVPSSEGLGTGESGLDISTAAPSFVTVQSSISRDDDDTTTMTGGTISSRDGPAHQGH